jgi:hypothetical protein
MASDQAATTRATSTPAAHGPAARASGGRGLKRAALYARVSTDKQEREETVVSQVDLLYQTAAAYHYEVLPGGVSVNHVHGFERFNLQNTSRRGGVRRRGSADHLGGLEEDGWGDGEA